MAVATRTSPATAERALDAFCNAFPEVLEHLVEVRVVADPEMAIEVGVVPGTHPDLPATLPGFEFCAIRLFESDARVEVLTGGAA